MTTAVPELWLALPGVWAQVPLHSGASVELLLQAAAATADANAVDALRLTLDQLAARGGDQLYLRDEIPTALITAWQSRDLPDPLDADRLGDLVSHEPEAMGGRAPSATPLPRQDDLVAIRAPQREGVAYWIARPGGRYILEVIVLRFGEARPGWSDVYDALASTLAWEEPPTG